MRPLEVVILVVFTVLLIGIGWWVLYEERLPYSLRKDITPLFRRIPGGAFKYLRRLAMVLSTVQVVIGFGSTVLTCLGAKPVPPSATVVVQATPPRDLPPPVTPAPVTPPVPAPVAAKPEPQVAKVQEPVQGRKTGKRGKIARRGHGGGDLNPHNRRYINGERVYIWSDPEVRYGPAVAGMPVTDHFDVE